MPSVLSISIPNETWTDVLRCLDRPEDIQRLSLVSRFFHAIAQSTWANKEKRCANLDFYREYVEEDCYEGCVRILETWQELPIPEVPPPQHLQPPSIIEVGHIDDRVLGFFRAITAYNEHKWLQDVVLHFDYKEHSYSSSGLLTKHFALVPQLILLLANSRISGLDCGWCTAITDRILDIFGGEQTLLRIPRLRIYDWECDPALLVRWLHVAAPANAGNVISERVLLLHNSDAVSRQLMELIEQEFMQATERHQFIVLHISDENVHHQKIERTNERTRERLVMTRTPFYGVNNDDGEWSYIRRAPLDDERWPMDAAALDRKYDQEVSKNVLIADGAAATRITMHFFDVA